MMWSWIAEQYADIRGNLKWGILLGLWWVVSTYGRKMLQLIPNIEPWAVWAIIVLVSLLAFVWVAKIGKHSGFKAQTTTPQITAIISGIPTLSNLMGQTPNPTFDAKAFFKTVYFSPITAEVEQNIKIVAHKESPQSPEDFYARFIGTGLTAFMYEQAWAHLFKSQFAFLRELNNQTVLPLSKAQDYYNQAVSACPNLSESQPNLDSWLGYLIYHQLMIRHPSDMIEITHKGRDFLKYIAHYGYNPDVKAC